MTQPHTMKLSITYLYTIYTYGYPPTLEGDLKALDDIRDMGFHFLEMESLGPEHGRLLWDHRADIKRRLERNGIRIHNFVGMDPDLVSLDDTRRAAAYERFKRTAELGSYFETDLLHVASYAPPVEYPEGEIYKIGSAYEFPRLPRVRVPAGYDWRRVWDVQVESGREVARTAARHGKTVIMEPRVGEVICNADSLRRLVDDVGMPNFKANFDTAHLCAHRENIPVALTKLQGCFANVHIADNDVVTPEHLPIGKGVIDWDEFFRLLKAWGYRGHLGLDIAARTNLVADIEYSCAKIIEIASRQGVTIEK